MQVTRPTLFVILSFFTLLGRADAQSGGPTGLYQLGAPNIRDLAFVEGGTISLQWDESELAPGLYDFSGIDQALEAVQRPGKELVIHPFAVRLPAHVLATVPTSEQYFNGNFGLTTALPWSPTALSAWSAFLAALSDHLVLDAGTGLWVRLADHPSLRSVGAPIVGLQGFRDIGGSLASAPNYSRPDFVAGILASTHASRAAFPQAAGHLAVFNIADGQDALFGGQSLGDAVLERLEAEFNGTGQPELNVFQENWSDAFPTATGSQGQNTLRIVADGGEHMLQATTSWARPFGQDGQPPSEQRLLNVASGSPVQGLAHAFNTFGTRWFEIYAPDFDEAAAPTRRIYLGNGLYGDLVAPYADELLTWNEFLSGRFAVDDAVVLANQEPLLIDVLANDRVPPGASVALSLFDVTPARHGSVTIVEGGARLSYLPGSASVALDQCVYSVSDGRGGVSSATARIIAALPHASRR